MPQRCNGKKAEGLVLTLILSCFVIFIILILLSFLRIGNQQVLEVKIDEVACAIGLNSSLSLAATNTSGPIGKLFNFPAYSILLSINHYFIIFAFNIFWILCGPSMTEQPGTAGNSLGTNIFWLHHHCWTRPWTMHMWRGFFFKNIPNNWPIWADGPNKLWGIWGISS